MFRFTYAELARGTLRRQPPHLRTSLSRLEPSLSSAVEDVLTDDLTVSEASFGISATATISKIEKKPQKKRRVRSFRVLSA